jgi:hypothetical protein
MGLASSISYTSPLTAIRVPKVIVDFHSHGSIVTQALAALVRRGLNLVLMRPDSRSRPPRHSCFDPPRWLQRNMHYLSFSMLALFGFCRGNE